MGHLIRYVEWADGGIRTALGIAIFRAGREQPRVLAKVLAGRSPGDRFVAGRVCAEGGLDAEGHPAVRSFEKQLEDLASLAPRGALDDFLGGMREARNP
jgi:hypothetical protein